MKRLIKVGIAAFAMAAVVPSFAEELETEEEEGAIGWTPVAFGLASPVQLPWGHCRWDVFGLNLGILYFGAPKMYGLGIAGLGDYNNDTTKALVVSGLMNWSTKDVYGMRVTCGANIANGTVYGCDIGGFGYRKDFWGLDIEFLGTFQDEMWGWQTSGLVNIANKKSYGLQSAVGVNIAKVAYGCQLAAIFNMASELHGFQIGCVNFADDCQWGLQIGLVNIIMSNSLKVLPLVNMYF